MPRQIVNDQVVVYTAEYGVQGPVELKEEVEDIFFEIEKAWKRIYLDKSINPKEEDRFDNITELLGRYPYYDIPRDIDEPYSFLRDYCYLPDDLYVYGHPKCPLKFGLYHESPSDLRVWHTKMIDFINDLLIERGYLTKHDFASNYIENYSEQ